MNVSAALLLLAAIGPEARVARDDGADPNLRFEVPFVTDGVSTVFDFAQGRDGAYWLATNNRLIRWNGFTRTLFGPTFFGSGTSDVFNVVSDARGDVWVGFGGRASACVSEVPCRGEWPNVAGIGRVVDGKAAPIVHPADGLDDHVWALAADADGIWIGTEAGVLRQVGAGFTRFGAEAGLADPLVTALTRLADGELLVGTRKGVQVLADGRFGELAPVGLVRDISEGRDGVRWIATADGLWRQRPGQPPEPLRTASGLPSDDVRGVGVDRWGAVWITTGAGLARIVDDKPVPVPVPGLRDARLVSVAGDREGGIWISSRDAGFVRGEHAPARHLGSEDGLPFTGVAAVSAGGAGRVWMLGSTGAVALSDNGTIRTPRAPAALPFTTLVGDQRGGAWLAGAKGLFFADQDQVVPARGVDLPAAGVTALWLADPNTLVVGSSDGRIARYGFSDDNPASLTLRARHEGGSSSCHGGVAAIAQAGDGTLWAAYSGGSLAGLSGQRMRCLNPTAARTVADFKSLAVSEDGTVWIANPLGLIRFRAGTFDRFDENDGLSCDNIVGVAADRRGHLWTACLGGLARVDLSELQLATPGQGLRVHPLRYRTDGGLQSHIPSTTGRPALALDGEGKLWLATPLGIEVIDVPDLDRLPPPPRMASIALLADDNLMTAAEPTVLLGTTIKLRAEIAALTRPLGARVRYVVTAQDGSTVIARSNDEILTVPPTGPGRYSVSALASSAYGTWSNQLGARAWNVVYPWHRRTTSWLAFGAVAILAAMGVVTVRARQAAAEAAAVQQERERLARDLHDNLGQDFASLGYHVEMLASQIKDTGEAADTLARTRSVLGHAQDDTRRAIWKLRSRELLDRGLVDGLRALNDDAAGGAPCKLDVGTDVTIDDPQIEGELLQVAREAVSNARRHAGAKQILVELARVGDDVRLRISDDGKGFEVKTDDYARSGHFGILGMHERVRRLGGSLIVESEPGAGTIVEAMARAASKPRG